MHKYLRDGLTGAIGIIMVLLVLFPKEVSAAAEKLKPVFTEEETEYIETCGTLKVGCFPSYIPVSYINEDGEMAGIFPDLVRSLGQRSGLTLIPVPIDDQARPADEIKSGKVPMVIGMVASDEILSDTRLQVTDTVYEQVIVAVKKEGKTFSTYDGCTVAIPKSFQFAEFYLKQNYSGYQIVYGKDTIDCMGLVAAGKADIALRDSHMANYYIQKPFFKKLTVEGVLSIPEPVCIVVDKEVDSRFISVINKTIASMDAMSMNQIVVNNTVSCTYQYTLVDFIYAYRFPIFLVTIAGIGMLLLVGFSAGTRAKYLAEIKEQRTLRILSETDELTGLYNRSAFYREAKKLMDANKDTKYMMIAMDIERFKIVNDLFGIGEGDKLLRNLADNLKAEVEKRNGICARMDSDRFICCLPYDEGGAHRLQKSMQQMIDNEPLDMNIILCCGVYYVKNRSREINAICDRAFLAASSIKGNYQHHIAEYSDAHREHMIQEQEVLNSAEEALAGKQFIVYLQPKNRVDTGSLVGAEALVRWKHPKKGIIPPMQFLPVFEHNGFIEQVDFLVLEEVCRLLSKWKEEGKELIPVSVNLSRVDFYNSTLCTKIMDLVEKYQIDPSYLEFEITETAYSDETKFIYDILKKLRGLGFKVLMDDFGSGYSSLNMLKDAPVDIIKMDLRFLGKSDEWGRSRKIIESIIKLADEIQMPVIAEGVEQEDQMDFLKRAGCQWAQGYYFSKPVDVESFVQRWLLKEEKEKTE